MSRYIAYFSSRMRETALFLLPVCNLTCTWTPKYTQRNVRSATTRVKPYLVVGQRAAVGVFNWRAVDAGVDVSGDGWYVFDHVDTERRVWSTVEWSRHDVAPRTSNRVRIELCTLYGWTARSWCAGGSRKCVHITANAPNAMSRINTQLEMWANAQRDGRPAEYRWRPLFNAAKFGWRPLLECRAVTLPRRKTRWNFLGCPKLTHSSQLLLARRSPYYEDMWSSYWRLAIFSDCRYMPCC